jgi:Kef-type K+ transport system membrane component KefB
LEVPQLLGVLALLFGAARLLGALAKRFGQPAVLGELAAGVVLGVSFHGPVDPNNHVLHVLAEIGVVVLLLEIGLETDLAKLLRSGGNSTVVAVAGVVLPMAGGIAVCHLLGQSKLVSIVAGAALTATSVGITARVLRDLGQLQAPESQIILGAAVIDDVLGLVILAVVGRLAAGAQISVLGVSAITAAAFGFLAAALVLGWFLVGPLAGWFGRLNLPGSATTLAVMLAFGLAWLAAEVAGPAMMILGAFVAGVLFKRTPEAREIHAGVARLGHFFVPIFFVYVGAAVDLRVFNPRISENWPTMGIALLLILVAVLGKFLAGYAPFWFRGRKAVIGVGMIPRGEVGLIFAQMGLASGIFDARLFSAVTVMVMATTFLAPPLLRLLLPTQIANSEE